MALAVAAAPAQIKAAKPKAQSATAKIDAAVKLLAGGKAGKAAATLSEAIASGKLKPRDMARALHYRGIAQRKQGLPAQAIADFTGALWLGNGLSASMKGDARQQISAAYREAGLPGKTNGAGASASWQTRTSAQSAPSSVAAAKPQPSSGGGVGGFFSNLFGGGSTATKPAAAPPPIAKPQATPKRPVQTAAAAGWGSVTAVKPSAGSANRAVPAVVARAAPGRAVKVKGAYRLLLSPVRSEAAAKANALKVKRQFAAELGAREAVVEPTVLGTMGTFYRVSIGPFAETLTPQSICSKLQAGGQDCMLVAR